MCSVQGKAEDVTRADTNFASGLARRCLRTAPPTLDSVQRRRKILPAVGDGRCSRRSLRRYRECPFSSISGKVAQPIPRPGRQ